MSKHTPGPWVAQRGGDISFVRTVDGGIIDRIVASHANATLIAAAPDMLKALEAIDCESDWLMACCVAAESCGRGPVHPKQTARSLIAKVRDAIAKAEGDDA